MSRTRHREQFGQSLQNCKDDDIKQRHLAILNYRLALSGIRVCSLLYSHLAQAHALGDIFWCPSGGFGVTLYVAYRHPSSQLRSASRGADPCEIANTCCNRSRGKDRIPQYAIRTAWLCSRNTQQLRCVRTHTHWHRPLLGPRQFRSRSFLTPALALACRSSKLHAQRPQRPSLRKRAERCGIVRPERGLGK